MRVSIRSLTHSILGQSARRNIRDRASYYVRSIARKISPGAGLQDGQFVWEIMANPPLQELWWIDRTWYNFVIYFSIS